MHNISTIQHINYKQNDFLSKKRRKYALGSINYKQNELNYSQRQRNKNNNHAQLNIQLSNMFVVSRENDYSLMVSMNMYDIYNKQSPGMIDCKNKSMYEKSHICTKEQRRGGNHHHLTIN